MASDVRVQLGSAAAAEALFEPICTLYDRVFSQPPFRWTDEESEHHRELLTKLKDDASFGIVTAEAGEQLVGFGYGFQLRPDTGWWQDFVEPLPAGVADEWPGRTFALIDLAVDEARRGKGLGRQLTDTLLAGRREERATLSVQPTASDAQAFYVHLGWRKVGRKQMPPGIVSPFFDVYVLAFRPQP
jgi:ribosomal protein S18 acetylase RimI-like enzyme